MTVVFSVVDECAQFYAFVPHVAQKQALLWRPRPPASPLCGCASNHLAADMARDGHKRVLARRQRAGALEPVQRYGAIWIILTFSSLRNRYATVMACDS